jgi:hypothetical protein
MLSLIFRILIFFKVLILNVSHFLELNNWWGNAASVGNFAYVILKVWTMVFVNILTKRRGWTMVFVNILTIVMFFLCVESCVISFTFCLCKKDSEIFRHLFVPFLFIFLEPCDVVAVLNDLNQGSPIFQELCIFHCCGNCLSVTTRPAAD